MRGGALATAAFAAALIGFSIPISTALDNVLAALVVAAFLAAGHLRERLRPVASNTAVIALLGFLLLLCAGALYGEAAPATRLKYLSKYNDLVLAAILVPLFLDGRARRLGLAAFGVAMALTLLLSFMLSASLLPPAGWLRGDPGNAVVFRLQITHNLLMAFAAFLYASCALRQTVRWKRNALWTLAALAGIDVLFLVHGRTGQIALLVLTVYFGARHFGWRGLVAGMLVAVAGVLAAWYFSSIFREHVVLTTAQYEQSRAEDAADSASSVGLRMEWYRNTLRMIARRPVLGAGTGGFPEAYAAFVTDPKAQKPTHPHNQFLLTAAETGVAGLAALVAMLVALWRGSARIDDALLREAARALVLTFAIGCLFNSLLVDHAEGLFFVWMASLAFAGQRAGAGTAA